MGIIIKEATENDLEKTAELKVKLAEFEREFDDRLKIHTVNDFLIHLKRDVIGNNNGKVFVAVDSESDEVVGFCSGWVQKAEWMEDGKIGYGCDCYVDENHRRMGIARMLVDALEVWFKEQDVKCFQLEVYNANEVAKAAWKMLGFEGIETTMRKVI